LETLNLLTAQIAISIENSRLYTSISRFLPREFLNLLEKDSVTEVKLGDHVEKEMTVLFSDIRGFTSMSEKMSPQDNFDFINAYLSRMEPVFDEHHGFIDKYIGDAIMALFPESVNHAVNAAINMLQTLTEYNLTRGRPGRPIIEIGIGIHVGILMLGTIGGKNRMDGTVISDAVNLAARVEELTKIYGSTVLITEQTYRKLHHVEQYKVRLIDRVQVKGKTEAVTVYEVFDADPEMMIELKLATLKDFEQGFKLYHQQRFAEAYPFFEMVLSKNESDEVAQVYLDRCQDLM